MSPCNNDSELGRSLTEMLGTLAVMGVLTIGGIAGFNYAMDKSKANDILDGINKRAIALSTYTLLGTNITASSLSAEFPNKIGDSTVAVAADNTGFDLIVDNISESVCDNILNSGLKHASDILLEGETIWNGGTKSEHACAESDNTITFGFNAALDNTVICGYCKHNENNTCVADETCDNGCPGDKPMKNSSGTCYSCDDEREVYTDAAECAKCPNRFWSPYTAGNPIGWCFSCNTDNVYKADAEECAKCPNRFMAVQDACASCSYPGPAVADVTECGKCSQREMKDGECVLRCTDGQFRGSYGYCNSCSALAWFPADAAECAKCSNREMRDGKCVLKECGVDRSRDDEGGCKFCSDAISFRASEEECAKCPYRFMSTTGYCYSCGISYKYSATEEECGRCPQREMRDGYCVLK